MVAAVDIWPNDAGFDTAYEEHEAVELTVKGSIPHYAAGVLFRTGPQGYKAKTADGNIWAAKHWFDGFSSVHRFQIDFPANEGPAQVQYRSRRVVDEYLEMVRSTGKIDSITFASKRDPCESYFKKVMGMFSPSRNTKNVGVTVSLNMPGGGAIKESEKPAINGHTNGIDTLHVKTDASYFKKIDPITLEPRGIATQKSLHPDLIGEFSGAHAKSDPVTGDIFNFNLKHGPKGKYRIFRTSASTGETDVLATFPGQAAYIHSIFLSENYVILCVWNSHIHWAGLPMLYHKNIVDAMSPFDSNSNATWYVVDRKHGRGLVATYKSMPFYCFHTINAWEEPSHSDPTQTDIIAELSMYENTDVISRFYYDTLMSSTTDTEYQGQAKKRLSSLPIQAQFRLGSIESAAKSSTPLPVELVFQADKAISMELPTINPAYLTKRHRFSYGCADRLKSSFMDGIVKFDNMSQTSIFWEKEGHTPGEPIFVADPEGTAEDDGVLLTVVLDGYVDRSYLLVLSARDLKEVGSAEMRGPMAFGFHGAYKAGGGMYKGDI